MSKPTPTFYILHGDDIFALEEEVAAMRQRMGDPSTADLNTSSFEGKTATVTDVFNSVSALPFLSDRRLTIVDGWLSALNHGSGSRDTLDKIVELLPDLPDWARLVFVERELLKENHRVLKLARSDPHGFVRTFNRPQNPRAWIVKRAEHYGAGITPEAVEALAGLLGDNLIALDNELFKLAAYVGEGRPIAPDDVAALTTYIPEEKVFDMVDALGHRDGQTAARLLQRLLLDAEPLSLFAMIVRQFRLLIQVREHFESGGGRGSALAQAVRIHSFVAKKLEVQSRNFSLADLDIIYHRLLDYDRDIKTGKLEPELALDLLVAALSA
jgi:DNA polymerase-3 subunit delta